MQHLIYIIAWQYWQKKKKKDTSGNLVFYLDHYLKSGKKFKYKRWLNVTINLTFHNLKRKEKRKRKAACQIQIDIPMKDAKSVVCDHKMYKLRVPQHASQCHDLCRLGDTYFKASK